MNDDGPRSATRFVRVPGQILFDGHWKPSLECAIQPITPLSVLGITVVGVKQDTSARKKLLRRLVTRPGSAEALRVRLPSAPAQRRRVEGEGALQAMAIPP